MILKEVLNELADKRSLAQTYAEYNYLKALEHQEFYNIEKKFREYNYLCAKNPEPELIQELEKIKNERESILKKLGLDISVKFSCERCQDTGFLDGKPCLCVKRKVARKVADMCGIPENIKCGFENCDFDVFKDPKQKELMKQTYEKMKEYCVKFPNTNFNSIVFSGGTGTGKTYLISCIAAELASLGFDVFFTTAFGLNNLFLKGHTAGPEDKLQYLEPVLECDLLLIDDLGTEPIYRNVTQEYLLNVINQRKSEKKHTLITTNLSLDDIFERYGERIFSRLNNKTDSLFLYFRGKDVRIDK
ncbi:MAG TPA: ATP-binding protein [Clostridia bacterium]